MYNVVMYHRQFSVGGAVQLFYWVA